MVAVGDLNSSHYKNLHLPYRFRYFVDGVRALPRLLGIISSTVTSVVEQPKAW